MWRLRMAVGLVLNALSRLVPWLGVASLVGVLVGVSSFESSPSFEAACAFLGELLGLTAPNIHLCGLSVYEGLSASFERGSRPEALLESDQLKSTHPDMSTSGSPGMFAQIVTGRSLNSATVQLPVSQRDTV